MVKDPILQNNCLAILVNMSAQLERIESHTAHRLLSLFELLTRQYSKWKQRQVISSAQSGSGTDLRKSGSDLLQQELFSGYLQMLFQVFNRSLFFNLSKNPHLVYSILYSKDIFAKYQGDGVFADLVANIETVIRFFDSHLHQFDTLSDYSCQSVLEVINSGLSTWKPSYFKVSKLNRCLFPTCIQKKYF
jgi:hypothetical protein